MKAVVLLVVLVAGAAHAEPKKTKRVPDKFMKAAGDAFAAATEADAKGDLRTALALFEKAYTISPHPSTMYNVADVQRRLSMLRPAIKSYELYLALSPDAKDRADVETLLEQLAKTPGTIVLYTRETSDRDSVDLSAGIVLVDGEIKRKPTPVVQAKNRSRPEITIAVPPGKHVVDYVTPITYATVECDVDPGGSDYCELRAEARIDGNVVISATNRDIDIEVGKQGKDMLWKRFELPAGKQRLPVKDHNFGCAPLALDVATGGNTITYAFIAVNPTEFEDVKRCRTLDIKQHRLQFEP